jgi:hypothetical protein
MSYVIIVCMYSITSKPQSLNLMRNHMKPMVIFLIALGLVIIMGACAGASQQSGVLEGKVSIGPITPVQQITPVPTPPAVYAARKVLIYDRYHSQLMETVSLDDNGNYRVDLAAGIYVVDINYAGIDRSSEVPKTVEIEANSRVVLNISIDTGIR